ncbi:acyl-CoA dehydrogenase family protein [Rhizorhabdus dicambivorans]|uniref:Acyl-CoA dehydrogenase n=1 Tax=Rhizorhabdus dicambivorans TaxID=1850238 RepID=A0A2A4FUB8_9SPHN|nr:acyl-CoA dehydrogenase family protein [Rhizorhabdus dicambivorans]ATE66217.1 acyl-CoA dehydrogenase [Rhizorhabdus dicambivorans]PCE41729.1 acyl-CoA dehydrogenase [Rhizorhabdus dicambivorans]
MSWGFSTDPIFQAKLDWIERFVREEVEPLDHICDFSPYDVHNARRNAIVKPLQAKVREQQLWACHLEPDHGGQGYGQLKLALMNEILGRSAFGPTVFGIQAPDTGNGEILAKFGTEAQKAKYLQPLLDNDIVSCFSMTEPRGGSDPTQFTCKAELVGDEWVINGEKWFSSHAHVASFLITMAVTDPDAARHNRLSAFIVPADTPGLEIVKNMPHGNSAWPSHAYLRYTDVRVPRDHLLGERGGGFTVAQTRLGGGRIHHAMRTLAQCKKALDMMCERALSRFTQGGLLSEKQLVQEKIGDSWMEIEQFRLLLLQTAWKIDEYNDYKKVLRDIAAVKVLMPKVMHDVASRALQIHGSLGLTPDMPFIDQVMDSYHTGLADGPTEIHKLTVAKLTLREHKGTDDLFPTGYIPYQREAALKKYADWVEQDIAA